MMSLLVNLALCAVLIATCATVYQLHRRLTRLGADLATYRKAIAESIAVLEGARQAMRIVVDEGREVAGELAAKIDEARDAAPRASAGDETLNQTFAASLRRLKSFGPVVNELN